jgi:hypothetical protein
MDINWSFLFGNNLLWTGCGFDIPCADWELHDIGMPYHTDHIGKVSLLCVSFHVQSSQPETGRLQDTSCMWMVSHQCVFLDGTQEYSSCSKPVMHMWKQHFNSGPISDKYYDVFRLWFYPPVKWALHPLRSKADMKFTTCLHLVPWLSRYGTYLKEQAHLLA